MTKRVPTSRIEQIVGCARHRKVHWGRAVSAEQTVYILHSQACRDEQEDLRDCRFSRALDNGINPDDWSGVEDRPIALAVWGSQLIPMRSTEGRHIRLSAGDA